MSTENLRKFLETASNSPALQARFRDALDSANEGDPSEALSRLAEELQLPVSAEEFRAHAASLSGDELDAAQLESIAGGFLDFKKYRSPWDSLELPEK